MAMVDDLLSAVDAFVSAPKRILGADEPYIWGNGYNPLEVKARFPIEVGGESPDAARLEIIGFPNASELKFRVSLCYSAAISRLDYTDETHPNTRRESGDSIPPLVTGPHYHSWALNRRFFKGVSKAPQLHNASEFLMRAQFGSILRWFCQEMNIDQPPGGHLIDLPRRERLL
jgi:hypothetical protein